jgi:hypothetical protein
MAPFFAMERVSFLNFGAMTTGSFFPNCADAAIASKRIMRRQ